jgi:hypothetical protein
MRKAQLARHLLEEQAMGLRLTKPDSSSFRFIQMLR